MLLIALQPHDVGTCQACSYVASTSTFPRRNETGRKNLLQKHVSRKSSGTISVAYLVTSPCCKSSDLSCCKSSVQGAPERSSSPIAGFGESLAGFGRLQALSECGILKPELKMAAAVGPGPVTQARDIHGESTKTTSAMLETATGVLQGFKPTSRIHAHLCAFHFYAYDMRRQVEAHHFCTHYNEDVHQCLIYDSPEKGARLIGIEYIVSEKIFLTLPDAEKKLWHSHEYEVKSGVLFLPGIPDVAEHPVMSDLCKTYGKVFHFWQFDKGDVLPLGPPQLMMALTADEQLREELAEDVEKRFGVSFKEKKEKRADLTGPQNGVHPLANSWRSGKGLVTEVHETSYLPSEAA